MFSSSNGNYIEDTGQIEWIISPASTTTVHIIGDYAGVEEVSPTEEKYTARPTINLKSEVIIKSGHGTKQEPFIVGLP